MPKERDTHRGCYGVMESALAGLLTCVSVVWRSQRAAWYVQSNVCG